jgi:hypothetical protein
MQNPNKSIKNRLVPPHLKHVTWYSADARGGAVVEALRYKPEGRSIDPRWCYWNFSLT